jgi:hypothetical protein
LSRAASARNIAGGNVRVDRPTLIGSDLPSSRTRVMAQSHAMRLTISALIGCPQSSSPAGAPGFLVRVSIEAVTVR